MNKTEAGVTALSQLPPLAWICLTIVLLYLIAAVYILLKKVINEKNIVTPSFKIEEKAKIQAETRELSDNQMRGAREILGMIKVELRHEADMIFADQDSIERDLLDEIFENILLQLLDHFRIDLVRNHIIKRNDAELKEYTQAKSDIYYTLVKTLLSEKNSKLPRFSLPKLLDNFSDREFYEIYYKAYLNARRLSSGY